jgi:hypothetical protein
VYAYCREAAGSEEAAAVAAEAFTEFRRAILPAGALTSGAEAERLLRAVSRRAALAHIQGHDTPPAPARCNAADNEILAYLERTLAPADHEAVAAHTSPRVAPARSSCSG